MRKLAPGLALLALGTVLAACNADGPSAPAAVATPIQLSGVAPECDPSGIRSNGGSSMVTTDWKSEGIPLFNSAQSETDPVAKLSRYYEFLGFLLRVGKAGEMQPSQAFPDPAAALYFMMASTIACAGDPQPDQLPTVVPLIYDNADTDSPGDRSYEICSVWNTATAASCATPNQRAATLLDGGFLARPALIIIEPTLDAGVLADRFGSIWSEIWEIEVHPIGAQANFGVPAGTPVASTAAVAMCSAAHEYFDPVVQTEKKEISHSTLRIATAPEGSTDENQVTELVPAPGSPVLGFVDCPEPPANSQLGAGTPLGSSRLAHRAWDVWQSAGATLSRWLAPQPLYAWDGGAGGGLRAFTSTFGTVVPLDLAIRLTEPQYGPLTTYSLSRQGTVTVNASQSRFGALVSPTACDWTSSHNRVGIVESGTESETALLTAGNSTGTATVRAICTLTDSRVDTANVVVTVRR